MYHNLAEVPGESWFIYKVIRNYSGIPTIPKSKHIYLNLNGFSYKSRNSYKLGPYVLVHLDWLYMQMELFDIWA